MLGNTVTIVCTPPYLAGGRNFLKLTAAGGRKTLQKAGGTQSWGVELRLGGWLLVSQKIAKIYSLRH